MLKIRLKRLGKKKGPSYRIVLMDVKTKRDGKTIEEFGFYNPITKECFINIQRIKIREEQGAQLTETVKNLVMKNS